LLHKWNVENDQAHRRRLYVSGTGAEGADKSRDVDGVEEVRRVGMSPSQPTTGSRERRKLPKWPGGIYGFFGISNERI